MRPRHDRPIKNGQWFLCQPGMIEPVGAGDLSFDDLDAIAEALAPGEVFAVVPERAALGAPPPARVTVRFLVDEATYVVAASGVRWVDRHGQANRQGAVWIRPGYRVAATGRIIRRPVRRVATITPQQVEQLLSGR